MASPGERIPNNKELLKVALVAAIRADSVALASSTGIVIGISLWFPALTINNKL